MYVLDVFVAGPTLAPDPEEKTAKPASEGQIPRVLCLNFASAKTCQDMLGDARIYDDIRCSGTFC